MLVIVGIAAAVPYTVMAINHVATPACGIWLVALEDRDWHSFVFFSSFLLVNSVLFVLTGGPLLLSEGRAALASAQGCCKRQRDGSSTSLWAPHVRGRLLSTVALLTVALSLAGRAVLSLRLLLASDCTDGTPLGIETSDASDGNAGCKQLTIPGAESQFTGALLETVPFVCVLFAIGEQVVSTSFTREGIVPWVYRATRRELPPLGVRLGEGTFGVVSQSTWRGQQVAIKELKAAGLRRDELTANLEREATLLSRLSHPNIVQFLGLVIEPNRPPAIITELCQGSLHTLLYGCGSCGGSGGAASGGAEAAAGSGDGAALFASALSTRAPLSWEHKQRLALQLCRGVEFLHTLRPPLIHRDLKPQNCLLDWQGVLKVADFGLSRLLDSRLVNRASPPTTATNSTSSAPDSSLMDSPDGWIAVAGARTPPDARELAPSTRDDGPGLTPSTSSALGLREAALHESAQPLLQPCRQQLSAPRPPPPPPPLQGSPPLPHHMWPSAYQPPQQRSGPPVASYPRGLVTNSTMTSSSCADGGDGQVTTVASAPNELGSCSSDSTQDEHLANTNSTAGRWSSIRITADFDAASAGGPSPGTAHAQRQHAEPLLPAAFLLPSERDEPPMMTTNCGTVHFAAPEVLRLPSDGDVRGLYSLKADGYSVGVLLWTIATREAPYATLRSRSAVMRAVKAGRRPPPLRPEHAPAGWQALITACLAHDESRRPDISDVRRALERMEVQ